MQSLVEECSTILVSGAVAAGVTDVVGTAVDRSNCEKICFTALLGDVTVGSVLTLKAQKGNASNGSDAADISGASVTWTADATNADNKILALEIVKPAGAKYVRCVLQRGTANAVVLAITADLFDYRRVPAPAGDVIASAVKQG